MSFEKLVRNLVAVQENVIDSFADAILKIAMEKNIPVMQVLAELGKEMYPDNTATQQVVPTKEESTATETTKKESFSSVTFGSDGEGDHVIITISENSEISK